MGLEGRGTGAPSNYELILYVARLVMYGVHRTH